ncbi:helix-turn-helix transcriptional regulator [Archangium sp.]|uniref:helix-turn-helix transcriptional regulator n=1 Tax=Archangium sp. TaxID=1872627 RepID=UPI002D4E0755|nr:helix-turn-helix domain-containing protein [Archangium sp.]HYO53359.1 helix-turn-helix domain-containing protein [Archangium sp.]
MASKTTFPVTPEQSSTTSRRGTRGKEALPRGKREAKQKLSKSLGDTAREARQRAGLTQADVAEHIGVATEVYGRLERGLLMPSVPTLRRLCLALNLPADALLSLGSAQPPAWADPSPLPENEGPQMRRLMRHVRKLSPAQLRALSLVAATLRRDG